MRSLNKSYVFLLPLALLVSGCMKTEEAKENFLCGTWSSYTPQGIHSPALNVHSFGADGKYMKVTLLDPPDEAATANANVLLTAYQIKGRYSLNGNILELDLDAETNSWHCEIDQDRLYLVDLASEGTNVVIFRVRPV